MKAEKIPEIRYASPLVNDYLFSFEKCASLFELSPYREASFFSRQEQVRQSYRTDRSRLAAALRERNERLGAGRDTLAQIERLTDPRALVVVTGQQAGVLGGPLYTMYKALTVIQLARREERRLGVPVVPVFWVAAEDHDWDEVARYSLLDREWRRRDLVLDEPPQGRRSIGDVPLPPSTWTFVDEVFGSLPDTEFKPGVLEQVATAARRSNTLVDWFARLMLAWFQPFGLVIADPMLPGLRALESEFFERALLGTADLRAALSAGMQRTQALGYPVTVEADPLSAHLFIYVDGQRLLLHREGDRFFTRGAPGERERSRSVGELCALARSKPQSFSNNVVTRPIVQDVLFPTLAYVGGPGEISYFGLYRETFRAFGLTQPIVYPRANLTLLDPPVARYLEKQGLTFLEAIYRLTERRAAMLEQSDRVGIDERFARFRAELERGYAELAGALSRLDPNMDHISEENLRQIRSHVNRLEEKARQHHRKNSEVALRQFERIAAAIHPGGQWQERVYNPVPFMVKYGPGLIEELMNVDLLSATDHRLVTLASPATARE